MIKEEVIVEGMTITQISIHYGIRKAVLLERYANGAVTLAELTEGGQRPRFPGSKKRRRNPDGTPCSIDAETDRRLHSVYDGMRDRCNNAGHAHYSSYGGRGIKVCEEWDGSYPAFREWALRHGYAPGVTLDRIDVDKGYSPENCRWASWPEQICNRRGSVYKNYRLRAKVASEYLRLYPPNAVVTITVRTDLMPDYRPKECDYET